MKTEGESQEVVAPSELSDRLDCKPRKIFNFFCFTIDARNWVPIL